MWEFILDLLFPKRCYGCGTWGKYICSQCAQKLPYFSHQVCPFCEQPSSLGLAHPHCQKPYGLDGLFVLAHYHGLIPKFIHEIKYRGVYSLTEELAPLIIARYHREFSFQHFVPIPLSPQRQSDRGFNQAEKLARSLGRLLSVPTAPLLIRTRNTQPQFDLNFQERKSNVKDAFSLNPQLLTRSLKNHSFCLVDDVATTGSTLGECAKVLKKSGADQVFAICLARGG